MTTTLPRPLFIGHPFGLHVRVDGALPTDLFAVFFSRTQTGAPVELRWEGSVDDAGLLTIEYSAEETRSLQTGTLAVQIAMRREGMAGILAASLLLPVVRPAAPSWSDTDMPLVAQGRAVRLSLVGEAAVVAITLQEGLRGRAGIGGEELRDALDAIADLSLLFDNGLI